MRNLQFIFSIALAIMMASCSSEKANENANYSDIEFQFEIVDSLIIDYLGSPLLCDFSPNKEYVLFFNHGTSEFIITAANGEIIKQFSKSGDIPDNPGTLSDRPIFYDNETIIVHGQKGIWAYNLDGESVWKIEREKPLSFWSSRIYSRSMYLLNPSNYFTRINYDQLAISASNDSLYENKHALKIVDKDSESIKPVIPLESFSRFLDGKGYQPFGMISSNHVKGNQMVLSYSKEDLIYLYEWKNQSFQLADTFSLNIKPFYLDQGKARDSFKDQKGFSLNEKVGEADVAGVWLLDENKVLVKYNSGIKESERKEPKLERIGESGFKMVMPDNVPKDKFQIYYEGEKYGSSFRLQKSLSSLLYVDDEFVWFNKNNEALNIEDDYAVFYKTKLIEKE